MWQTQKGAGKVADVPKSPKTHCAHPSRDQGVGTGLAPLPTGAVPVWEMGMRWEWGLLRWCWAEIKNKTQRCYQRRASGNPLMA